MYTGVSRPEGSLESAYHPIVASIDLGTNSCRLLIVRVNIASFRKGPFSYQPKTKSWKVLESFGRTTRLGEKLHDTGKLSDEGIDRAMDVLSICRQKLDNYAVSHIRVVATEACRQASNTNVLVERAAKELNLNIEVITSEEEARLSLTGCASVLNPQIPYAVMFDIGGGSTECIWLELESHKKAKPGYPVPFQVIDSLSLPYGVINLSERVAELQPSQMFSAIRDSIKQVLEPFVRIHHIDELCKRGDVQLIGSSGTVTTLAAIKNGISKYERRFIDGMDIKVSELQSIVHDLMSLTPEEKTVHPYVGSGRENLVIVGASILQGICDATGLPDLRVADRGVREGIVSEVISSIYRKTGYA